MHLNLKANGSVPFLPDGGKSVAGLLVLVLIITVTATWIAFLGYFVLRLLGI
jgi:hypothetical protein